jgi:polyketide biosynthesis enoyl-CoA hydratase PksI
MPAPLVSVGIDRSVATIRMQDVLSCNALSLEMVAQLEDALDTVSRSDDVHVVVLAGLPDYFCTGASREMLEALVEGRVEPRELLLPRTVLDVPKPVIAAMEGHAIGGGLALGLCADIALLAGESRYGANFVRYGFTPGMGITELLIHTLGPMLANELLLSGELVKGERFRNRGGFNDVLAKKDVLVRALDLAARIAENPPGATGPLKVAVSARRRALFESARSSEIVMHRLTFRQDLVRELLRERFGTPQT